MSADDERPAPFAPATVPEERQVGADLREAMAELASDLRPPHHPDLAHRLEWLVDVLVLRGHLTAGHRKTIGRIRTGSDGVHLATYPDKRKVLGVDRDCAALLPLCQGRCCSFAVSLSAEDVGEGKLPWDLLRPYVLPRDPATGYCGCLDAGGRCTVYDERPGTCRAYDCAHDPRVWLDFDAKIPAPMPSHLRPRFAPADDEPAE